MDNGFLQHKTLVDIIRLRAQSTPEKTSCIFLNRDIEEIMSYAALDTNARAIAATLQAHGMQLGDRVLLLFSPGLAFIQSFLGCLYAGCIAVPIYPPAQEKLADKAHRIITNSQPKLVLMTREHLNKFALNDENIPPHFLGVPGISIDEIDPEKSADWQPAFVTKENIAFLQYTSGSTMHPKGVMVTHHNLLDNLDKIYHAFRMHDDSVVFSWLPPHHDMGLIGAILTPIFGGLTTVMMSPFSFLQNPLSWLKNITKYQATISGSPNFAYDYCVKRIKEEKKTGLDLSSWQIAFNGAEPIRDETLNHFYHAFRDYGFRKEAFFPCYGLAEATLFVSGGPSAQPYKTLSIEQENYRDHRVHFTDDDSTNSHVLVSCGEMSQKVIIVDPDSRERCDVDQVGEIWIHSNSVGKGYWQLDKETLHAFHGKIKGDREKQLYLRTGDLGFIHENELYVTGRIKDLIIMYGKNHYPQDIEYSVMHSSFHKELGKCAAFVVQTHHEYQLILLCEVKNKSMTKQEQDELFNAIFSLIYRHHQLEINTIVLTPLKTLPHTTSGKIRRNFCRQHLLDNTLPIVAMWQLSSLKE